MATILPYRNVLPRLGQRVLVVDSAVVIGDVQLGDDSSVWYGTVLRGDVGAIRVGRRTNLQDMACVHVTGGLSDAVIGDEVTVGHRAVLHSCTVGDGCLIGIGSILLDGASVGEGSVVGAGALVPPNMQIPARSFVLGCPAKVLRPAREHEIAMGRQGAAGYVELAREYLGQTQNDEAGSAPWAPPGAASR